MAVPVWAASMAGLLKELLRALADLAGPLLLHLGGRAAARQDELERCNAALRKQNDMAARPRAGRRAMLERMRRGRL